MPCVGPIQSGPKIAVSVLAGLLEKLQADCIEQLDTAGRAWDSHLQDTTTEASLALASLLRAAACLLATERLLTPNEEQEASAAAATPQLQRRLHGQIGQHMARASRFLQVRATAPTYSLKLCFCWTEPSCMEPVLKVSVGLTLKAIAQEGAGLPDEAVLDVVAYLRAAAQALPGMQGALPADMPARMLALHLHLLGTLLPPPAVRLLSIACLCTHLSPEGAALLCARGVGMLYI